MEAHDELEEGERERERKGMAAENETKRSEKIENDNERPLLFLGLKGKPGDCKKRHACSETQNRAQGWEKGREGGREQNRPLFLLPFFLSSSLDIPWSSTGSPLGHFSTMWR